MRGRLPALIVKELLALFRDPKSRLILMGPPVLQLIVFSFAATLEVKNVSLIVLNQDVGKHGYELIQRLSGSSTFTKISFVDSVAALKPGIDRQLAMAALYIPEDFSRDLEAGQGATLQVILDGRRSNAAQLVSGYITQLVERYEREIVDTNSAQAPAAVTLDRSWFNENLIYLWFTVPSLVAVLAMLITLIVTALSVARERELGTFDQLLVSPLMPFEILLGKTIPAVLVGMGEGMVIFGVGVAVFGVPFKGSVLMLLFSLLLLVLSIVGIGLFLSSISKTQQQAILGAFIFMVPAITLSGYAAPVENMPDWLQTASWINPLKHALITVKGLFLKDMPFDEIWANTWPLLIIALFTISLANWLFNRRLE